MTKTKEMRRGLKTEITGAFDLAIDMCGSFHPDAIEPERRRLRKLRAEVLTLLCPEKKRPLKKGR